MANNTDPAFFFEELVALVLEERRRQNAKFGPQERPINEEKLQPLRRCEDLEIPNANRARQLVNYALKNTVYPLTWLHILSEEVSELAEEDDEAKQFTEAIQVVAVGVAALQQILRNRQRRGEEPLELLKDTRY